MSVALVIKHAKRMGHIILPSVACPAVQYFSTLLHKSYNFRKKKKVIEHKMCFDFLYKLLCATFLILRKLQRDIIINVHRSSCKVPVICQILMKLEFSRKIFAKMPKYQIW